MHGVRYSPPRHTGVWLSFPFQQLCLLMCGWVCNTNFLIVAAVVTVTCCVNPHLRLECNWLLHCRQSYRPPNIITNAISRICCVSAAFPRSMKLSSKPMSTRLRAIFSYIYSRNEPIHNYIIILSKVGTFTTERLGRNEKFETAITFLPVPPRSSLQFGFCGVDIFPAG